MSFSKVPMGLWTYLARGIVNMLRVLAAIYPEFGALLDKCAFGKFDFVAVFVALISMFVAIYISTKAIIETTAIMNKRNSIKFKAGLELYQFILSKRRVWYACDMTVFIAVWIIGYTFNLFGFFTAGYLGNGMLSVAIIAIFIGGAMYLASDFTRILIDIRFYYQQKRFLTIWRAYKIHTFESLTKTSGHSVPHIVGLLSALLPKNTIKNKSMILSLLDNSVTTSQVDLNFIGAKTCAAFETEKIDLLKLAEGAYLSPKLVHTTRLVIVSVILNGLALFLSAISPLYLLSNECFLVSFLPRVVIEHWPGIAVADWIGNTVANFCWFLDGVIAVVSVLLK